MPSTIIIIPAINIIVAQLIPPDADSPSPAVYQKEGVIKFLTASASMILLGLFMIMPKITTITTAAQSSVAHCLSIFSVITRANIIKKTTSAKI